MDALKSSEAFAWAKELSAKVAPYVEQITNSTPQEVIDDLKNLRFTPAAVAVSLTTVATVLLVSRVVGSSSKNGSNKQSRPKKRKKKLSKAQQANKDIQTILDHVEEVYVKEIDEYLNNFAELTKDDIVYKYNYFEEMLLKELMKLDGVDVSGSDKLRENRKKVIKFIQDHQKRLDQFREEAGF